MNHQALGDLLSDSLRAIVERGASFLASGSIDHYVEKPNPFLSLSAKSVPPRFRHRWQALNPEQSREQNALLNDLREWWDLLKPFLEDRPPQETAAMSASYDELTTWISLRLVTRTPETPEAAAARFHQAAGPVLAFLDQLRPSPGGETVLVLDTSALIDCPDLQALASVATTRGATLIVPPTVISELDALKDARKSEDLLRRVREAIRQLDHVSSLGDPLAGVDVSPGVVVRMLARSPDFSKLPAWLDPAVNDDGIVATALRLQYSRPKTTVSILTSDINMRNKARLARLPTLQPKQRS